MLASFPILLALIGTLVLAFASVEVGYRWARGRQRRLGKQQEKEAPVNAMVGATLGLLGFLLAFTFGMAADGFQGRKHALLSEATAIRTAYLRASLIPEPQRSEVRGVLAEYAEERLRWAGVGPSATGPSAQELHARLWAQVERLPDDRLGVDAVALFIESVNEVIALHAERVMVRERSRIPDGFWLVLYVVAALSLGAMGYHAGVAGTVRGPVTAAVAITFSLVIAVIMDLDRPGQGMINVDQQAMIDVRDMLSRGPR